MKDSECSHVSAPALRPQQRKSTFSKRFLLAPTRKRDILNIAPISPDAPTYLLCGKKFIFIANLTQLVSVSFMFGYMDIYSLVTYRIYVTTMTGNLITCMLSLGDGNFELALLSILVIIAHTWLGTWLSAKALILTNDRQKALFFLLFAQGVLVSVVMLYNLMGWHVKQAVIIPIAGVQGALFHWSSKSGFSCALQTINFQKLSEFFYRFLFRYSQGGYKARGDSFFTFMIIVFFVLGCSLGLIFTIYADRYVLLPMVILNFFMAFYFGDMLVVSDAVHDVTHRYFGHHEAPEEARSTSNPAYEMKNKDIGLVTSSNPMTRDLEINISEESDTESNGLSINSYPKNSDATISVTPFSNRTLESILSAGEEEDIEDYDMFRHTLAQ